MAPLEPAVAVIADEAADVAITLFFDDLAFATWFINYAGEGHPIARQTPKPTKVYRLYNAESRLLYVGWTCGVLNPRAWHGRKPWWSEVDRVESQDYVCRFEAAVAKLMAVRDEGPLYNPEVPQRSPAEVAAHIAAKTVTFERQVLEPDNPLIVRVEHPWAYANAIGQGLLEPVEDRAQRCPDEEFADLVEYALYLADPEDQGPLRWCAAVKTDDRPCTNKAKPHCSTCGVHGSVPLPEDDEADQIVLVSEQGLARRLVLLTCSEDDTQ